MHIAFTDTDSVKLLAQTEEVMVQQPEVVSLEVSLWQNHSFLINWHLQVCFMCDNSPLKTTMKASEEISVGPCLSIKLMRTTEGSNKDEHFLSGKHAPLFSQLNLIHQLSSRVVVC